MSSETLDALLIDRALGQLSPDVIELLDAYLVHNAPAAGAMGSTQRTVNLARTALAHNLTTPRPLPAFNPRRPAASQPALRLVGLGAAMAASLALGLFLGRSRSSTKIVQIPPVTQGRDAMNPRATLRVGPNDFWSADRLAAAARRSESPHPASNQAALYAARFFGSSGG